MPAPTSSEPAARTQPPPGPHCSFGGLGGVAGDPREPPSLGAAPHRKQGGGGEGSFGEGGVTVCLSRCRVIRTQTCHLTQEYLPAGERRFSVW